MPKILKHIDKIAREKQRDVLFVDFRPSGTEEYQDFKPRQELLSWLNEHVISYEECGPMASEFGWESYRGQVYIDLPFDQSNDKYRLLDKHLMTDDDKFKIKGVEFYYVPLDIAMKNAHHDEPGFWEKWAEDF